MVAKEKLSKGVRTFIILGVIVGLGLSMFFSLSSFTGYVVSEEVNTGANFMATIFLLVGVGGAYFYVKKLSGN